MATTTIEYPTESRTTIQRTFGQDDDTGEFNVWERSIKETTTRKVFTGSPSAAQSAAEAAVSSALSCGSTSAKTDGVARRCSDCGWWEAIIVTVEYSEWENLSDD